jgi:hypothetical protein
MPNEREKQPVAKFEDTDAMLRNVKTAQNNCASVGKERDGNCLALKTRFEK